MAVSENNGAAMWTVGFGRADITGPVLPVGMMGYADPAQVVEGVAMPLCARAMALRNAEALVVLVNAELWGITPAVRAATLARLRERRPEVPLTEATVMLAATHTHSGPGGYSHHVLFNLTIGGFVPEVFEAIVVGLVDAILAAVDDLRGARVRLAADELPIEARVGINRSLAAYNRNADVAPVTADHADRAIDRTMTTLRADDPQGKPRGAWSWFGVHGCSLHADNRQVHPDNKGIAAAWLEQELEARGVPGFTAAFPQTTPGDVSPNVTWSARRGLAVGVSEDDEESVRHNGRLQGEQALRLFDACAEALPEDPTIRAALRYVDFGDLHADQDLAGVGGAHTSEATIGVSMALGTLEGPGPLAQLRWVPRALNATAGAWRRIRHHGGEAHGAKFPMLQLARGGRGRAFGVFPQWRPPIPARLDPIMAELRRIAKRGASPAHPWTPTVLPLHLLQLGRLLIVGLPFEPTTVAGRRVRHLMLAELGPIGVEHVVVAGYTNAYSGYLTTPEEYDEQAYEGGSTYMGRWSLPATLTVLRQMARGLAADDAHIHEPPDHDPRPQQLTAAEVDAISWSIPKARGGRLRHER